MSRVGIPSSSRVAVMMLTRLEARGRIGAVVLTEPYATNRELVKVLGELYPSIAVECEV